MLDKPWFDELSSKADIDSLRRILTHSEQKLWDPRWQPHRQALEDINDLRADRVEIDRPEISFDRDQALSTHERQRLQSSLRTFMPWKKGPFRIFEEHIDAEWRSDFKWQRLAGSVGSLDSQLVADIGCHNGYFMYRMLGHGARRVIGFEPFAQLSFTFRLFQQLYPLEQLHLELLGVEHVDLFPDSFDTIFCLGILYHHTDPVGLLRKLRRALKSKGRLYLDCQGIPGDEPLSLTPQGRYAGAGGQWFLPTMKAMENWALRAGFSKFERIYSAPLGTDEQRRTGWAPIQSLEDFLDPSDPSRTCEGYPAPWRHYLLVKP